MADNTYRFGNHSDVGMERTENQDYFGYFKTHLGELFIVCDGVGGENGGEIASQLAVNAVHTFFDETDLSDPFRALAGAIAYANTAIRNRRSEDKELSNMSTTIVAFLLQPGSKPDGWIAHLGDSRFYRIRQGGIEQITKDHSQVQEMVDHGIITAEEAEGHSNSHIISRYLGMDEDKLNIDISEVDICRNDRYISCTDGITGMISDEDILHLSKRQKTPQKLCMDLVNLANKHGGRDNSTAQVIDIRKGPNPPGAAKRIALRAAIAVVPVLLVVGGFILLGKPGEPPAHDPNDYPDNRADAQLIISGGMLESTITETDSVDWFRTDQLEIEAYSLSLHGDEGILFTIYENPNATPHYTIELDSTVMLIEDNSYDIKVTGVISTEATLPLSYTIKLVEPVTIDIPVIAFNIGKDTTITFDNGNPEIHGQFPFNSEKTYTIEILKDSTDVLITLISSTSDTVLKVSEAGQDIIEWSDKELEDSFINVVMTTTEQLTKTFAIRITDVVKEEETTTPNTYIHEIEQPQPPDTIPIEQEQGDSSDIDFINTQEVWERG